MRGGTKATRGMGVAGGRKVWHEGIIRSIQVLRKTLTKIIAVLPNVIVPAPIVSTFHVLNSLSSPMPLSVPFYR